MLSENQKKIIFFCLTLKILKTFKFLKNFRGPKNLRDDF